MREAGSTGYVFNHFRTILEKPSEVRISGKAEGSFQVERHIVKMGQKKK